MSWIQALYRLGTAPGWYRFARRVEPWALWIGAVLLSTGWVWGLLLAPPDIRQGDNFRIIYVHVPMVSVGMGLYLLLALCGLITLVWRVRVAAVMAAAVVPVGALATALGLASGALWGSTTWGTWWVWDARLVSTLVLLLLYLGYRALTQSFDSSDRAERAGAVLALVGVINVPIIRYSVEWWNSLHQGSTFTISAAPAMPPSMWQPLLLAWFGIWLVSAWLLLLRTRTLLLRLHTGASWLQRELGGC